MKNKWTYYEIFYTKINTYDNVKSILESKNIETIVTNIKNKLKVSMNNHSQDICNKFDERLID